MAAHRLTAEADNRLAADRLAIALEVQPMADA